MSKTESNKKLMKSTSKTKLEKVTVEFPCDNVKEDMMLLINDGDFLANLSISNDYRNNPKKFQHKVITPTSSMTSTGVSLSPQSSDQNINNYDDYDDYQYYEDFSSDESQFADELNAKKDRGATQRFDFDVYHDVLEEIPSVVREKKYKNGTRASLTFSNERVREIDRDNEKLLRKIMENGSAGSVKDKRKKHFSWNDCYQGGNRKCNAEVNRRHQQKKIDHDNQILKRKLETISRGRKPKNVS